MTVEHFVDHLPYHFYLVELYLCKKDFQKMFTPANQNFWILHCKKAHEKPYCIHLRCTWMSKKCFGGITCKEKLPSLYHSITLVKWLRRNIKTFRDCRMKMGGDRNGLHYWITNDQLNKDITWVSIE
jgi:hypothetical protein